ncbi:hypothetical protein [Achromobacter ruhlandii]|uniref:hypothetical protein n=1 Tax=Achromobacter ruhlandii TaxID=72557 RepID=UPI0012E875A9|nr:hypothetical protein [Achromobacter ruhlandii]
MKTSTITSIKAQKGAHACPHIWKTVSNLICPFACASKAGVPAKPDDRPAGTKCPQR